MFESYAIGVDLGRVRDFTAIAVVERSARRGEFDPAVWAHRKIVELKLRHLERIPLGTAYTEVARRVASITHSKKLLGPCRLVVDNTGVGAAVMELLRDAGPNAAITPVTITGGNAESASGDGYLVPKRDLIVGLQVMLEKQALQIAGDLPQAETLVQELMQMQVKATAAGNEQYGVWREGKHDDLVLAVALACWYTERAYRPWRGQELWWETEYEGYKIKEFKEAVRRMADDRRRQSIFVNERLI